MTPVLTAAASGTPGGYVYVVVVTRLPGQAGTVQLVGRLTDQLATHMPLLEVTHIVIS